MIRWTIYRNGSFVGFSTAESATEAIVKYARLNPGRPGVTKGLTAARPVN